MSRLIKNSLLIAICAVAALTLTAYVSHSYRSRVRATIWHVLHGNSTTVAGYRIRVPRGWFVEQPSAKEAHFWNTATGESIWFRASPKPSSFTLDYWSHLVQEDTGKHEIQVLGRRDFQIAGDSFRCLEQNYGVKLPPSVAQSGPKELRLPSVDCKSAGPLDATFYAGMHAAPRHNYDEFYSLLASIQKQ